MPRPVLPPEVTQHDHRERAIARRFTTRWLAHVEAHRRLSPGVPELDAYRAEHRLRALALLRAGVSWKAINRGAFDDPRTEYGQFLIELERARERHYRHTKENRHAHAR